MSNPLLWVQANRLANEFPDTAEALAEPDGLLAAGGDLNPERLLNAYRNGIFPWYTEGQPILWWAPNPRSVLVPAEIKISRSLAKTLRKARYEVSIDRDFLGVLKGCAAPRRDEGGTWITQAMIDAYQNLHGHGFAHSVECWDKEVLVGGLYGVAIGCVFFGESMFSSQRDASKIALATLAPLLTSWGYRLIDCQVHNPHLASLGARTIARESFNELLRQHCKEHAAASAWSGL